MLRGLIFDFDGLILDTETPEYQSWQEIFQEYGLSLPIPAWAASVGTSADHFDACAYLEAQLERPIDRERIIARQRRRSLELIAVQPVEPGITTILAAAKERGLKIGLASSSSSEWVTGHLTRLDLIGYFDCIRGADHVQNVKPDPELYLSALSALELPARQVIALEDSPNGVLAAQRAGLFCVAVPNPITRQLDLNHADLQLDSLAALPLDRLLVEVAHRRGLSQD
jgi:HAD superfamily hydrolase (TIGR01509 family)